jgi:hypothetical protein
LDSDDAWKPEKLGRQIRILESSEDVGFVHTFTEVINADGSANHIETERRMKLYRKAVKRGYTFLGMSQECIMFLSTVILRRSLLQKIGPMDASIAAFEDWDWYLRGALVTEVTTVQEALVLYRMHQESTGMNEFTKGRIQTSLKHLGLLDTALPPPLRDQAKCNFYVQLAAAYYQKGDMTECGSWMRRATNLYAPAILRRDNWRYLLAMCLPRWAMAAKSRNARELGADSHERN